jgi:16S rRNA (adenine1518-N6/adenine1519-N6)-dimethyltransferase
MSSLRSRLAERGLAPSRSRGQNFLRSEATAARLVELVGIEPADAAVEIGPGTGQLTRAIAARARRTVALEVDRGLVALLAEAELPASVEVRHQDALRADLGGLARELGAPVVLIGNLPYSIAGRLLGALLGPNNPFRRWGFMLQREVADRVLAEPDTDDYGTLAVWARLFSRARRVLDLGPHEFEPRPKVRSSFVVFDPPERPHEVRQPALLRRLVRAAFQQRRKTLRRALEGVSEDLDRALAEVGIEPRRRGETLDEREFARLANALSGAVDSPDGR